MIRESLHSMICFFQSFLTRFYRQKRKLSPQITLNKTEKLASFSLSYEILGFCSGVYVGSHVLGYDTVSIDRYLPVF
jgi:hypothetical protein